MDGGGEGVEQKETGKGTNLSEKEGEDRVG